ncbi:hypothetical protein DP939_25510 [Spongiactinospora rosea]|uniref:Uncharacterized protein n=1 Tax=Spongiactinospora rosea TaxID=2248750 RepID=A0A366LVB5_9ACTN|nr:hypothetical protein [Spongiactinospora rosea]RBQ17299.1 hypothetical protein DP939_25510 [Spongiactinospora rosea]
MEIKNPPTQEVLFSLGGDAHVIRESILLSPNGAAHRTNGLSRDEWAMLRLQREAEAERLVQFRDRQLLNSHIAMYIGLATVLSGVVLVATKAPDTGTTVGVSILSAIASGVILYLKATFMKSHDRMYDHIQKMRELDNQRANQDAFWATTQLTIDRGHSGHESVIKALLENRRADPEP